MSVRVKICGLTDERALDVAIECRADAVGFVLAPSPRRVSLERARELLERVPPGIERVLVFACATRYELQAAFELGADALQAEVGSDWPPALRSHQRAPGGAYVLPVLRDGVDVEARAASIALPREPMSSLRGALVLDGPLGGGRGLAADVERARQLARHRPIVLAGGLTPENVAACIRAVRPFAVDASSGLERSRGVKDGGQIRAFVRAVRSLEDESLEVCP